MEDRRTDARLCLFYKIVQGLVAVPMSPWKHETYIFFFDRSWIILYPKRILHQSCQAIYRSTSVLKKYLRVDKYLLSLSQSENKTRGPWWSYIAHLTKQICIFTVEVSAKFTALGFLYKLYSTNHPHPLHHTPAMFFTNLDDLNWILKEGHQRNISAKLYWNWSSGLKIFI